ncbi:MAG: tryptophan--tRNA ligase [bacterium]
MRIVSGIQPTGIVHLGNYFGTLTNWVKLQNEGNECFWFIADQHAITIPQKPKELKKSILDVAATLLTIGLDPEKSTIFVQSDVPEHSQLNWVFNCLTPVGLMEGMIQFKEKSKQENKNANIGLFTYPILMAADILLYKADAVPVGVDQSQHMELTRDIVKKFNNYYGEFFKEPKTLHTPVTKLLGLDGKAKMSKSLNNYIGITEDTETIWKKLATAATDPARVKRTDPGNPDKCNIYTLHKLFSPQQDLDWVNFGCRNATIGCIDCKKRLYENMMKQLNPIREKYIELINKPERIKAILKNGAEKAQKIACKNLAEIYDLVGFKY